jgi:NADH-quinone oxidoreductase subunit J
VGASVAFWVLAVIAVLAALAVVLLRDVFRAALSLVLCFLMVAGLYLTLSADFLAAVQILIYVGAISVLIILAIMLTREVHRGSPSSRFRLPAFFIAVLFFAAIAYAMLNTPWQLSSTLPLAPTTPAIAGLLFGEGGFILPVEIAPVLLLAAILGAIVLVREK